MLEKRLLSLTTVFFVTFVSVLLFCFLVPKKSSRKKILVHILVFYYTMDLFPALRAQFDLMIDAVKQSVTESVIHSVHQQIDDHAGALFDRFVAEIDIRANHLAKSVPPQAGQEMSDGTRHQSIVNSVVEPQAPKPFHSDSTNVSQNSNANQASDSACGQGIFPFQINRVLNYFFNLQLPLTQINLWLSNKKTSKPS